MLESLRDVPDVLAEERSFLAELGTGISMAKIDRMTGL